MRHWPMRILISGYVDPETISLFIARKRWCAKRRVSGSLGQNNPNGEAVTPHQPIRCVLRQKALNRTESEWKAWRARIRYECWNSFRRGSLGTYLAIPAVVGFTFGWLFTCHHTHSLHTGSWRYARLQRQMRIRHAGSVRCRQRDPNLQSSPQVAHLRK